MKCEVCGKKAKAKSWVDFKELKHTLMELGLFFGSVGGLATAFIALIKAIILEGPNSPSPTTFSAGALVFIGVAVLNLSVRDLKRIEKENERRWAGKDDE